MRSFGNCDSLWFTGMTITRFFDSLGFLQFYIEQGGYREDYP